MRKLTGLRLSRETVKNISSLTDPDVCLPGERSESRLVSSHDPPLRDLPAAPGGAGAAAVVVVHGAVVHVWAEVIVL